MKKIVIVKNYSPNPQKVVVNSDLDETVAENRNEKVENSQIKYKGNIFI